MKKMIATLLFLTTFLSAQASCLDEYNRIRPLAQKKTKIKKALVNTAKIAPFILVPVGGTIWAAVAGGIADGVWYFFVGSFASGTSSTIINETNYFETEKSSLEQAVDAIDWAYAGDLDVVPQGLVKFTGKIVSKRLAYLLKVHHQKKQTDVLLAEHTQEVIKEVTLNMMMHMRNGVEEGEFCSERIPFNLREIKRDMKKAMDLTGYLKD